MKSVDLICSWPKHLDYPLFRKFIHDNRDHFNKVIIAFTDMSIQDNYSQFVRDSLEKDDVTFTNIQKAEADEDWRNKAVNQALTMSDSEWVLFIEQDFSIKEGFWERVEDLEKQSDVFGYYEDVRLHPCCIFIKRDLLEKTSKDFGIEKDKLDHFGKIHRDLQQMNTLIGAIPSEIADHMNGLSQNMFMLQNGIEPNFRPDQFKKYCEECLQVDPLHQDFKDLFEWYIKEQ